VVRQAWDAVIARDKGIAITEQADWGSVTSERLMTMADKVEAGEMTEAAASAEARRIILGETQVKTASR
jgi:hypothetical protein